MSEFIPCLSWVQEAGVRGRIWWYTQDHTGEGGREFVSMLCLCAGSGRGEEEGEGEGCRNRGAQPTYTDHTGITDIYGPVPTPNTDGGHLYTDIQNVALT